MEQHIVVVDQTVSLLRTLRDSSSNINAYDKETLDNLSSAFSDVLSALQQCLAIASLSPTSVAKNICARLKSDEPGKPASFQHPCRAHGRPPGFGLYLHQNCGDVGSISLDYIKEDQRLWFRRFQVV